MENDYSNGTASQPAILSYSNGLNRSVNFQIIKNQKALNERE
jgi:hypothetical protein